KSLSRACRYRSGSALAILRSFWQPQGTAARRPSDSVSFQPEPPHSRHVDDEIGLSVIGSRRVAAVVCPASLSAISFTACIRVLRSCFVLSLGQPSVDEPLDAPPSFSFFSVSQEPAPHVAQLLHHIHGGVEVLPLRDGIGQNRVLAPVVQRKLDCRGW